MSDMALELKPRKITVAEYHRMAEAGILAPDERLELVDGILVEMSPIGRRHWALHAAIVAYLNRTLAGHASVVGQLTLPLGDFDEPQPDIAIFAHEPTQYFDRQPTLEDIYALIEIADWSLARDTGSKRDLYARFEIREYLVVDVNEKTLLRYTAPRDRRYGRLARLTYGETFALGAVPDVALNAEAFLPP